MKADLDDLKGQCDLAAIAYLTMFCMRFIEEDKLNKLLNELMSVDKMQTLLGIKYFHKYYMNNTDIKNLNTSNDFREAYTESKIYDCLDTTDVNLENMYAILSDLRIKKKVLNMFGKDEEFIKNYKSRAMKTFDYLQNKSNIIISNNNTMGKKQVISEILELELTLVLVIKQNALEIPIIQLECMLKFLELNISNNIGRVEELNETREILIKDMEFVEKHPKAYLLFNDDEGFDERCLDYLNRYKDVNFIREAYMKGYAIFYKDCE